ncbi:MAG: hypothetical protein M1820_010302 [Bogoriella megaspora]|nr:MAG: hypothetical protein M1820_010302 [Bogoriella megaspora]
MPSGKSSLALLLVSAAAAVATNCSAVNNYAGTTAEKFAGQIPPCAVECDYKTLAGDGCALDDFYCHCVEKTQIIADIIVPCLANSTCTGQDIGAFAAIVDDVCLYYNATTNGTCPTQPVVQTTLTGEAAVAATAIYTSVEGTPASTAIPANYKPTATEQLLLSFHTDTYQIQPGEELGINVPDASGHLKIGLRQLPEDDQIIETPPAASIYKKPVVVYGPQLYLAVMVDPDAPYPQDPTAAEYLHWLQPNLRLINASTLPLEAVDPFPFIFYANQTDTPARLHYSSPQPPNNSAAHRYILYVYQQPLNFTFPQSYAGYGPNNRSNFNVAAFARSADLGDPLAATYFYVANYTNSLPPNSTNPSYSPTFDYRTINAAEATSTGFSAGFPGFPKPVPGPPPPPGVDFTFPTGFPHGRGSFRAPPGFVGVKKAREAWAAGRAKRGVSKTNKRA